MRMLTTYIPTRSFASDLLSEMDRFLDDWNQTSGKGVYDERAFSPACEISETPEHFLVSVDLPGMKQDEIKIEMSGDALTVSGERKRELQEKNQKWQRYEKSYGFFKRSFALPTSVESDKIEARYANGVLELYLPKAQAAKPKQIQIQSGKGGFFEKLLGSKKNENELKDVNSTKVS